MCYQLYKLIYNYYLKALSKLCQQYLSRSEYQIASDTKGKMFELRNFYLFRASNWKSYRLFFFVYSRYIPEKWKMLIEQYAYIAEKKQVSSKSLLHHCDYFRTIRDQKNSLNLMVLIKLMLKEAHSYLFLRKS